MRGACLSAAHCSRSQSLSSLKVRHSLSLGLLQVFQTISHPDTRHLAGWLQSWNQRRSLCVSQSFLIIPSHVEAYMHSGEIFLRKQIIKTQSLLYCRRCRTAGAAWRWFEETLSVWLWWNASQWSFNLYKEKILCHVAQVCLLLV